MNQYAQYRQDVSDVVSGVKGLFRKARSLTDAGESPFRDWEKTCDDIEDQLSSELIRVAVVGAIKSGKSTFVNALFKGDYLKRGAGVVTSIVTRIRRGKALKARLYFKSWDQVNADVARALAMFPEWEGKGGDAAFDIRNADDRGALQAGLDAFAPRQLAAEGALDANTYLLHAYLKGYDRVKNVVADDRAAHDYADDQFPEHRTFVGDDALAVYLEDVEIDVDQAGVEEGVEVADCQGSDSPNPLHLAMIQDYLQRANFTIYVISSRTGLRRADIRFLSIIKKMGILDNVLFIVNFDFNEHESLESLQALIGRIREELSMIAPDAEIFALSALLNLFEAAPDQISPKDAPRAGQWRAETDFFAFSASETQRFTAFFNETLTRQRVALLLKNNLERLSVILAGMRRRIDLNQALSRKDAGGAREIMDKVRRHQEKLGDVRAAVKSALDGARHSLSLDLRKDIDRLFDVRAGALFESVADFIDNYRLPAQAYEEKRETAGFAHLLYLAHQDFKQALDGFMAETAQPEIIRFVKDQEKRIIAYYERTADSFHSMFGDARDRYNDLLKTVALNPDEERRPLTLPPADRITARAGVALPPAVISPQYTVTVKAESVARLGLYRCVRALRRLFRRPVQEKKQDVIRALKDGVSRMKRDTAKSMTFHFKNYRENLKFQYIFKVSQAVSDHVHAALTEEIQSYAADLSRSVEMMGEKQADQARALTLFDEMDQDLGRIERRLRAVKEKVAAAAPGN